MFFKINYNEGETFKLPKLETLQSCKN